MASSLSDLANNLSEGIHRVKYKFVHDDKKCGTCGIEYKCCDYFFEYTNFKDGLKKYKCLLCNKNCQRNFDERLKERSFDTYKFPNHDDHKFILSLQKGAYPYEYMDDCEKFNETSLPEKEDFYSHLNLEHITGAKNDFEKIFF